MENKETNNRNWLSIMLISVSALFLLFAIFYAIGRTWGNSSAEENNNIEQPSNINQNSNSNNTTNENSTTNNTTTPDTSNSNQNPTNETTTLQNNQSSNFYDNVTALEIDTLNYSLIIKQENTEKVQVEYNNVPSDYTTNLENDGTLHLTSRRFSNPAPSNNNSNSNSSANETSGSIIITIPKKLILQGCDINGGTGVISISDLTANDFDLDCGSGNVILSNINLHDTDIECNTGLVDISGSLSGETEIQCNRTSLNLRLTDYNNNYNMKVKKGTGELIVNGETHDTFALVPSNTAQTNTLEIEGGSGNINIDF